MEWQKIFAKYVSDKGVISRISKELLHKGKDTKSNFKWAKELSRHFPKEGIQMANKHMKRYSILFIIKKMQIKTQ